MGCSFSDVGTKGVGLSGSSAKAWLKLEDAPASFKIARRSDGGKGIVVEMAGMDKYGLLGQLESAFRHRGFVVDSAAWFARRALVHGSFQLWPLSLAKVFEDEAEDEAADEKGPPECRRRRFSHNAISNTVVTKLVVEAADREHTPTKVYNQAHQVCNPEDLAHTKIEVEHNMKDELRTGFLRLVAASSGHTCRGEVVTLSACFAGENMQRDRFWIDCPYANVEALLKGPLSSAGALREHLREARALLEEEREKASTVSDTPEDGQPEENWQALLDSLKDADRRAMHRTILELPVALQRNVSKVTYKIEPTSWGRLLPGFQKFIGAGVVLEEGASADQSIAPVVQFTTLFVSNRHAVANGRQPFKRSLQSLMRCQYAEFVNTVDVYNGRFTVQKAFLNNVCPAGQSIGAFATAEHPWAPVWENGAQGIGELLPVNKVREIKLSDVVNWNTYSVMCVALNQRPGNHRHVDFGDNFQASLDHEMGAAKVTLDQCKSLPLAEIFLRTNLGRFVKHVLKLWHQWSGISLVIVDVNVVFLDDFERIAGEYRDAMDIYCKTCVDDDQKKIIDV
mmetsp:Transcript_24026/g.66815  ORF Transcript_24026/g.66815 Transcript_24026/m.66815 type:complete len:567 (+) Transcript_24026:54-1754(+)